MFDKYEVLLTKSDEALYLQNKVNGETTMERIKIYFGPFNEDEIEMYRRRLLGDDHSIIHPFQKELIFNLFYKYFGDTSSINTINETDYIILLMAAKKICLQSDLRVLPCVFSSKIIKYVKKSKLNKSEKDRMVTSPYYKMIGENYNSKKALELVEEYAAKILYSEFEIIEYDQNQNIDGLVLPKFPDYIVEEVLKYVSWIS